jgi:hypothetical protein
MARSHQGNHELATRIYDDLYKRRVNDLIQPVASYPTFIKIGTLNYANVCKVNNIMIKKYFINVLKGDNKFINLL